MKLALLDAAAHIFAAAAFFIGVWAFVAPR